MKTLISRLLVPEGDQFQLPLAFYCLLRSVHAFRRQFIRLSDLETKRLRSQIAGLRVDRPVYICGIARAGTTITLEILSQHPDVGTHQYIHGAIPYLPCWWYGLASRIPFPGKGPVERIHRDGILVTEKSPEAMEEPLWDAFFDGLHDENHTNVLDSDTSNADYEVFYKDHIQKLLFCQGRTRYVAKNNYNVTRMEYLLKIFPHARFLLIIRNPVNHIASLIKQNRIFGQMALNDFRMYKGNLLIGHHEFGPCRACINVGDIDTVHEIRRWWSHGKHARGWAIYWASIYHFVADRLKINPLLSRATRIIRYEDLCRNPSETLDRIIAHTELSKDMFVPIRERYVSRLHEPRYYSPGFSIQEQADIAELTRSAAIRFGYEQ